MELLSNISTYSILIWIAAAITASFGLVVYIGGSTRSSRVFLVNVATVTLWIATVGAFISAANINAATILVRLAYLSGILISMSFFLLSLIYPEDKKINFLILVILGFLAVGFTYLYLFTDLIIASAEPVSGIARYGWMNGPLQFLFIIFFYPFFFGGMFIIARKIFKSTDKIIKWNLLYMFIGIVVLITPPTFMNVIMPEFGYFELIWLGPILSFGWIGAIAYSMAKFRQLDIKTFTTEMLNIALVIIFFVNIFTSISVGLVGRFIMFLVFLAISVYIIKLGSRVDDLNHNLQAKVDEQTKEIRSLYEIEKTARQELERLNEAKDQFIMVTQHHLRTPLTQIKWYLESLAEKKFDILPANELKDAHAAVDRLNHTLDNFLDIAQLQVGKAILNLNKASLLPAVKRAETELSEEIGRKGLNVVCPTDKKLWPEIPIDESKIGEVIFIVFQNAAKYNNQGGTIDVKPEVSGSTFKLVVSNSGIGIDPVDLDKLFSGVFTRGSDAVKINPLGMGMGLTFAKYIIEAHHGSIDIKSEGLGRGAEVTLNLPIRLA